MNPLTNVKNINKLNEVELSTGSIHKKSWHDMYKGSAWIFIGGLEYGLTEGDVITVFSQYGEVVNINLVRDKKTGKSKGYCFICFANQKSTVLAVDNLNGIKLCNRTIRVDHVADYKPPKEDDRDDEITRMLKSEGCAPKPALPNESSAASNSNFQVKKKKSKKEKKKKKKRKHNSDENNSDNDNSDLQRVKVKKEKHDAGYDKYDTSLKANQSKTEKRNHQGREVEDLNSASSHSHDKSRLNHDRMYQNDGERSSRQGDQFSDGHRSKERSRYDCEGRAKYKDLNREDLNLIRNIKRERSSSSERNARNYKSDARHETEKRNQKSKHPDSKRKERREKSSSSSSSDSDSSSQSSSEDERRKTERRNYGNDQYKSYNERREESRHGLRHVSQSRTDEYPSSRKYTDARERDYDYNSKDRHHNDRHSSQSRDSFSKYKYDKR